MLEGVFYFHCYTHCRGILFYLTTASSHFLLACLTYKTKLTDWFFPKLLVTEVVTSLPVICTHHEHLSSARQCSTLQFCVLFRECSWWQLV